MPFSYTLVLPLLLSLGPLLGIHRYPQTVFWNEWVSVLVLCVAVAWAVLERRHRREPAVLVAPVLGGFVLLAGLGLLAVGASGWAAYALLLFFAMLATPLLMGSRDIEAPVAALAAGCALGALLQCLVSIAQLAGLSLGGAIMPKIYNAVYGNVAQPNHFGNLLWLGQASLIYLAGTRRVDGRLALAFSAVLSLFAALSASRAVWLYTLALPLLCVVFAASRHGDFSLRRMARISLAVAAISVLMQVLMAVTDVGQLIGVVSSASRAGDANSNGQRLFDWIVAWRTGLAFPWTGSGPGSFAWQTALHSVGMAAPSFIRIGENAHNTPLNLLAEFGWPLTVLTCGGLAGWLLWRWRRATRPEALWAFLLLAVIGAHSMVEYPLWYTYFLIPVGLALGLIVLAEEGALPRHRPGVRWLAVLAWGVVVAGLAWSLRDYRLLEGAYARFPYGSEADEDSFADSREVGARIADFSLFAPHARALQIRAWPATRTDAAGEVAALCKRHLPAKPNFQTLTQCALAYAQSGQEAPAAQAAAMVCGAYPAIYHGRFPAALAASFRQQGWSLHSDMYCIR